MPVPRGDRPRGADQASRDAVLLDTHVVLWWRAGAERLSATARTVIAEARSLLMSPVSCWEISMLVAKQRVRLDRPVQRWVHDLLAEPRVELAELSSTAAVLAGSLPDFHGDPADRLLYATARIAHVPLLSKDRLLTRYGQVSTADPVDVLW